MVDINNPYKKLGGGALDQQLFRKHKAPSNLPPSPSDPAAPVPQHEKDRQTVAPVAPQSTIQSTHESTNQSTSKPMSRPTSQSTSQLTSRSTNQSTTQSTQQSTTPLMHQVVERPKAFYITKRLDKRIDEAVTYLQEKHGIKKVDRSTIVNAIMDNESNWSEETLDLLVDRVISLLTSRLTS